jgi:hypothetical protein
MVTKKETTPEEFNPSIYYAGVFDYDKLIKTFAQWYNEEGYEFREMIYKHKVPSPSGSEQELKVEGWKKITEYVQYWIYVRIKIWELKELDVVIDGEKKKMARGKLQITFSSSTWLDYNNKFNTEMAVRIQDFLHKYVWHKQITGGWTDECYYYMYKLHRVIKETLNMSTPTNAAGIRY